MNHASRKETIAMQARRFSTQSAQQTCACGWAVHMGLESTTAIRRCDLLGRDLEKTAHKLAGIF